MDGMRFKLVTGSDPELFEERLNRFVESLPEDAIVVDVKLTATQAGEGVTYAALVQYKRVEPWQE
ncbi:hypothetical protein [Marinithermus hydrothermalis]|nr:hypothetical protein [Marinithermus hydrothermalis]